MCIGASADSRPSSYGREVMSSSTQCGHGKTMDEHCIACEAVFKCDAKLRARVKELEDALKGLIDNQCLELGTDLSDAVKALANSGKDKA